MIEMKQCTACGQTKPAADFTRQASGHYGLSSQCRPCRSAYHKAWREANRTRHKELHARATRKYQRKNRRKVRAYNAVQAALRDGRLVRQPCEVCGSTDRVEAHHDDYSRPLDVRWLCRVHHAALHAGTLVNG